MGVLAWIIPFVLLCKFIWIPQAGYGLIVIMYLVYFISEEVMNLVLTYSLSRGYFQLFKAIEFLGIIILMLFQLTY